MFEVRIHGRGGQGVVTAAEILSIAAFLDDKEAQAFPSFGSERMGAPVTAFCRIDSRPIRSREPVTTPNAIIVQDTTLLANPDLFNGLADDGFVLLNSSRDLGSLGVGNLSARLGEGHVLNVAASDIARKRVGKALPNAALLGGLVAMTVAVSLESLKKAIERKFPGEIGRKNAAAADEAFSSVRAAIEAMGVPTAADKAEPVIIV